MKKLSVLVLVTALGIGSAAGVTLGVGAGSAVAASGIGHAAAPVPAALTADPSAPAPVPTPPGRSPLDAGSRSSRTDVAPAAFAPPDAALDFVSITPCRIVDTRTGTGAGGTPFGSGTSRSFTVAGTTGFAPQGGRSGGCGIPAAATAVAATVTAVAPSGNGYMRAWPNGSSEPAATFFTYPRTNASTGVTQPVRPGAGQGLRLKNYGGPTDVVIDVTGYWAPKLQAVLFSSDGTVYTGTSRVIGAARTATGEYHVDFDRDVTGCAVIATPYTNGYTIYSYPAGNRVHVYMYNLSNTLANQAYTVNVVC